MIIHTIPVGYLKANCYILEKNNKVIIIDPGSEYDKISSVIKNKEIIKILITHYHQDHIGALENFDKKLILNNPEEKTYFFPPFKFKVIYTKGHTADSVTFYFEEEKAMFTGDFIFKENIGRTDLPTGNIEDMRQSLKIIKNYPNDITIYPGHGPKTNLKQEKEKNYFLR